MKVSCIPYKNTGQVTPAKLALFAGGKNGRIRTLEEANRELKRRRRKQ